MFRATSQWVSVDGNPAGPTGPSRSWVVLAPSSVLWQLEHRLSHDRTHGMVPGHMPKVSGCIASQTSGGCHIRALQPVQGRVHRQGGALQPSALQLYLPTLSRDHGGETEQADSKSHQTATMKAYNDFMSKEMVRLKREGCAT